MTSKPKPTLGQRQLAAAKAAGNRRRSELYAVRLVRQCNDEVGLAIASVQREYRFDPARRWRFDLAWPHLMLAVEIEGGTYVKGRHVSTLGFRADAEKYLQAAVRGWCVVRVLPEWIGTGPLTESLRAIVARLARRSLRD